MKSRNRNLIISVLFLLTINLFGQTTLKEIHSYVKVKDYKTAEPLLKQYIKGNSKEASAYLFLGLICQQKLVMAEGPLAKLTLLDSAILCYRNVLSNLTISYLKKNQEYFDAYRRRDVRTGAFGVKYEDILLDMNNKISSINSDLLQLCRTDGRDSKAQNTSTSNNRAPDQPTELIKSSGKYYAIIIGVSEYDNNALNLIRPVVDAQTFVTVISERYSFEKENVKLLLNPTRQQILSELVGLRKKITPLDNLLIFYAGHGIYDEDVKQGYWWPRDADSENPSNWLSNNDLREQIRGIKSAHTLLIADACFSGGIFRTRGPNSIKSASFDIVSLYKLPSRRAITSGTMTTVPDQSVFFEYLMKSLKYNAEKYLSSQALFDSFRLGVINNTLQVPQDGIIAETGDEGGDFVFIKRE